MEGEVKLARMTKILTRIDYYILSDFGHLNLVVSKSKGCLLVVKNEGLPVLENLKPVFVSRWQVKLERSDATQQGRGV